jgi:hypothetical protein
METIDRIADIKGVWIFVEANEASRGKQAAQKYGAYARSDPSQSFYLVLHPTHVVPRCHTY